MGGGCKKAGKETFFLARRDNKWVASREGVMKEGYLGRKRGTGQIWAINETANMQSGGKTKEKQKSILGKKYVQKKD